MGEPFADISLTTLRLPIRAYGRLPEGVTGPLNLYSGGGRCEGDSIVFILATCRIEEIFAHCRAAGIAIPATPTALTDAAEGAGQSTER